MKQFWVQFSKDFKSNFSGSSAYVILAAYYMLSIFAALYLGDYFLRESEIMNAYFVMQPVILTFIIPATTMRTWADEAKSGTLELLLTQPISYGKLVLAKFFSAYLFFAIMAATSLFLFYVSNKLSVLDLGLTFSGYFGLFLAGALFTAAGCCISSLCRNNILSYVFTIFFLFFITQFELTSWDSATYSISLRPLNFEDNFDAFLTGVPAVSNVLYFVIATALFLWLNTAAIECRRLPSAYARKMFSLLAFLLLAIFCGSILSANFLYHKTFDMTDAQKYTLPEEDISYLEKTDKRVDIMLYEAKNKREEANSSYAVYAEFVERIFKLIEFHSHGAIRTHTILVEPFSQLEHQLVYEDNIPYEEDKFGQKIFMAATFSDNEGTRRIINNFSNLRQNLLEADILRVIKQFGSPRKKAAFYTSEKDRQEMLHFHGLLQEFYDVRDLGEKPLFIPPEYDIAIVVNPSHVSTETLLAMEQYVLSGGNLLLFADPDIIGNTQGAPLVSFLKNFGIAAETKKTKTTSHTDTTVEIAHSAFFETSKDVRAILVNGTGKVSYKNAGEYTVFPLLSAEGTDIAAVSAGKYVSNYIKYAMEGASVEPVSTRDGKLIFVADSDILKDYIYVSDESKGNGFYQTVPLADNMLFFLRLLSYAAGDKVENTLSYRHYPLNTASIGNAVLAYIRQSYNADIKQYEDKKASLLRQKEKFYDVLSSQGYASVKNIGDISHIEQDLNETESKLYQIKSEIASYYQSVIMSITLILLFAVPAFLLVFLLLGISKRYKQYKIRRLIDVAKTY